MFCDIILILPSARPPAGPTRGTSEQWHKSIRGLNSPPFSPPARPGAPRKAEAAAAKRGKWTSLNGRATDSVLLHCPETKEDCDWPSEDRRCRRRRLAAARDRPSGQGRRQPSTTAGRAVRRARAGRAAGRGRLERRRRRWREKGEERRHADGRKAVARKSR